MKTTLKFSVAAPFLSAALAAPILLGGCGQKGPLKPVAQVAHTTGVIGADATAEAFAALKPHSTHLEPTT